MRLADAPPPGWYPDPTGGHQLWWWDGLDWTTHRRVRPPDSVGEVDGGEGAHDDGGDRGEGGRGSGGSPVGGGAAGQSRTRTAMGLRAAQAERTATSDETAQVLAEARRVAREEVDKAVRDVRNQVDDARGRYEPMVREWLVRGKRWLRTIAISVTVVLVLGFVLQAMTQATLLDWLGDRIDAVTSVVRGRDVAASGRFTPM